MCPTSPAPRVRFKFCNCGGFRRMQSFVPGLLAALASLEGLYLAGPKD
jgi:hypothetical protein